MSRRALIFVLAVLPLLPNCRQPEPADPVILSLKGQIVRRSDFERHLATVAERGEAELDPSVRHALLSAYLEERVLVLEARAQGLLGRQATVREEESAVENLLATAAAVPAVTDEEVSAYYEANPEQFQVAETLTLRQILVPTQNEARDLLRRLQKEPRSFEKLARTRSRGPEAAAGGLMGRFSRGQLPEPLERAAFALPEGGRSGVVESPLGYHVLRVDRREPERRLGLDECREKIRAVLARERTEARVRELVRELMERAEVNHEAFEQARRDDL